MRAVHDKRRKLMAELMRDAGFGIPVMPQGVFYLVADAST
jgi:aspartate/methionine/tyrosine aminotransferase